MNKVAAWNELRRTSRKLKGWISATTLQLLAKAEVRLTGSLEHHKLQVAAARSARAGHESYWVEMAEEMEVASKIGEFGMLSRFQTSVWLYAMRPTNLF